MQSDTFDEVLGLEEQFYNDGHKQGLADGVKAGRIEGRTFGLEKGFEKYIESGRLHGKSLIWASRLSQKDEPISSSKEQPHSLGVGPTSHNELSNTRLELPQLPDNARLTRNVKAFYALAESDSLSTENTEEAVSDFDDRFKRAQAKAKIIERMAGESSGGLEDPGKVSSTRDGSIEDISPRTAKQ
jgi:hypothetical protein